MKPNPVRDAGGITTLGFVWLRDSTGAWTRKLFRRYNRTRALLWTRLTHVDASLPYCPACLSHDVTVTLDPEPQWWCAECEHAWWTVEDPGADWSNDATGQE